MNIRKTENLHIVFWLTKDLFWAADFKIFGLIMIVPTLGMAVWLSFKTRKKKADLMHNLAIVSWICANVVWMIGEFYFDDGTRPIALVFFVLGLAILALYYAPLLVKNVRKNR